MRTGGLQIMVVSAIERNAPLTNEQKLAALYPKKVEVKLGDDESQDGGVQFSISRFDKGIDRETRQVGGQQRTTSLSPKEADFVRKRLARAVGTVATRPRSRSRH